MPIPKIIKPRKSPPVLRKRILSSDEFGPIREENVNRRPLPAWMQPPVFERDSMSSRPAQSPPEVAPAFVVPVSVAASDVPIRSEELLETMSGNFEEKAKWSTVQPKRVIKRKRHLRCLGQRQN